MKGPRGEIEVCWFGGNVWKVGGKTISESSGQIITTSAEVTLNGGLIRELPQNPLNSGLGIILICPESCFALGAGDRRWKKHMCNWRVNWLSL